LAKIHSGELLPPGNCELALNRFKVTFLPAPKSPCFGALRVVNADFPLIASRLSTANNGNVSHLDAEPEKLI
jgi:hypothetical protein